MLKTLTNFKWLNLFERTYTCKGKTNSWIFASRRNNPDNNNGEKADAVIVAPIFGENVVVIKQYRPAVKQYEYEFPAGLVDPNETDICAAKRELKEETGLTFNDSDIVEYMPPSLSSAGMTDESISMVFTKCHGKVSTEGNEESEDIKVILLTRDEIRDFLDDRNKMLSIKARLGLTIILHDDRFWPKNKTSVEDSNHPNYYIIRDFMSWSKQFGDPNAAKQAVKNLKSKMPKWLDGENPHVTLFKEYDLIVQGNHRKLEANGPFRTNS